MDKVSTEEFLDAIGFKVVRAGDELTLPNNPNRLVIATEKNGPVTAPEPRHGPKGR